MAEKYVYIRLCEFAQPSRYIRGLGPLVTAVQQLPDPAPATRRVTVRCTYTIEVDVPTDVPGYDERFDIEENHCPGTGRVGAAFDAHRARCDAEGVCWACGLGGRNEIVEDGDD